MTSYRLKELIEKYEIQRDWLNLDDNISTLKRNQIREFLQDLRSLNQESEEPNEKEVIAYDMGYSTALENVISKLKKEKRVWIPYKNGLEKWIEIAESLDKGEWFIDSLNPVKELLGR